MSDPERQFYQDFYQAIQALQATVTPDATPDQSRIQSAFETVQQMFQTQRSSLGGDGQELSTGLQLRSLQIEIDKQLRLVSTDLLFLRTARQTATRHQRQAQIRDRILLLLRYCEAILENWQPEEQS